MLICFLLSQRNISKFQYRPGSNDEVIVSCCGSEGDIVIPKTVKEITEEVFGLSGCDKGLTSISFQDDSEIISIGEACFFGAAIELANLSNCNKLAFLNSSLFAECPFLETVILPNKISGIGEYCFRSTSSLQSITFPGNISWIGYNAFYESKLISITIQGNLSSIEYPFYGCNSLINITILGNVNILMKGCFEDVIH